MVLIEVPSLLMMSHPALLLYDKLLIIKGWGCNVLEEVYSADSFVALIC